MHYVMSMLLHKSGVQLCPALGVPRKSFSGTIPVMEHSLREWMYMYMHNQSIA